MRRLVIYGTGGHGREMALAARSAWDEIVFLDDDSPVDSGLPVLGHRNLMASDEVCIAVGSPSARRRLAQKVSGHRAATVIDPSAVVDPTAQLGEGAQVCAFSYIGAGATAGRHFQCNVRAHLHHDCRVGDFVTFSPGVMCLGRVHVGDDVFIGAGAILRNGTHDRPLVIGRGAVVGMGAIVTRDVPEGVMVVGNPARAPG